MRVLTATRETQGQMRNDFFWCIEGELVTNPQRICDRDLANPDGGCGCGRAWVGLGSARGTTTAMVRDLPSVTRGDVIEAVADSWVRQGWGVEAEDQADLEAVVTELLALAADYEPGTVFVIRAGAVQLRREPRSAV